MSDSEPIVPMPRWRRGRRPEGRRPLMPPRGENPIAFSRGELDQILGLYGRKVADGEWRDYAIDALSEKAVFSVFRRSTEFPLYRIEKRPKNAAKQGMYAVIGLDGRVLKRGQDLAQVLRVFERKMLRVVRD